MSGDIVNIIRSIIQDELKSVRLGDIGLVTSIFPHAGDDDGANFECNVRLRESELELRKVPMTTPHIGMVSAPRVGDLVYISYVGGDINRPIITGRLYSDEANPPLHEESEWRVEVPFQSETFLYIDKEQSIVLSTGKTHITIKKDDLIEIMGETDLNVEVKGNVSLKCSDCIIDASGNIDLGTGGGAVITDKSHKCYFTGAPLVGSQSVKAKG